MLSHNISWLLETTRLSQSPDESTRTLTNDNVRLTLKQVSDLQFWQWWISRLQSSSALSLEAADSSRTSVHTCPIIQHHIPEDHNVNYETTICKTHKDIWNQIMIKQWCWKQWGEFAENKLLKYYDDLWTNSENIKEDLQGWVRKYQQLIFFVKYFNHNGYIQ